MPLKKATGNMYEWVDFTHTHLGGECPHLCRYCYVDVPPYGRAPRYQGELRLIQSEFKVNYDEPTLMKVCEKYPAVIFEENCNDMLAAEVPFSMIRDITRHCRRFPENTYVFQSKNPSRFLEISDKVWPVNRIFGTTIETNRLLGEISKAPSPYLRYQAMQALQQRGDPVFVTIEPVIDFDVDVLAGWIADIHPQFLNLGADSKNHHLPEPTVEKVMALVEKLHGYGIELREKHNLQRLKAR